MSKLSLLLKNDILRNSVLGLAFKMFGLGMGFVISLTLANALGVSFIGVVSLATSVAIVLKLLISLGSDTLIIREVSRASANKHFSLIRGMLEILLLYRVLAITLMLIFFLGLMNSDIVKNSQFPNDSKIAFIILVCAFVVGGLSDLWCGYLRGVKQSWRSFAIEQSLVTSLTLLFVGGVYLFSQLTYVSVPICYLTSHCLSVLIGSRVVKHFSEFNGEIAEKVKLAVLLKSSLPFMLTSSMSIVMLQTDTLMLGAMLTTEEVGIYSIAMKLALLTSLVLVVSNAIVAPKISELYVQGKVQEMLLMVRKVITVLLFSGVIILVGFIFFGEVLLGLWGVSGFSDLLVVLAFGQFINLATGPVGHLLMMTEYAVLHSKVILFMTVINVVLNYWLISSYGLIGAAIATATVVAMTNFLSWVLVWIKYGQPIIPVFSLNVLKGE